MSIPNEAAKTNPEGRESNGQFARGNAGGPGNPYARQVAELRSFLLLCVTKDDIAEVADSLLANAKQGDVPAARLLFQYLFGKPIESAHPDRLDQDELAAFRANTSPQDIASDILAVPLETTLELKRAFAPSIMEKSRAEALRQFTAAAAKPAVNKRQHEGPSATKSVPFPESESLRLIDLPTPDDNAATGQAANKPRS